MLQFKELYYIFILPYTVSQVLDTLTFNKYNNIGALQSLFWFLIFLGGVLIRIIRNCTCVFLDLPARWRWGRRFIIATAAVLLVVVVAVDAM